MNMRQSFFIITSFALLSALPGITFAQVVINEIAWMGSAESANHEWIELYNTSDTAIVLDGWKLTAQDGTPSIDLSGTINSRSYFLLERTSDSSAAPTADIVYAGGLGNTGEYLELADERGVVIDFVDAVDGWLAGDNTTKQTMQKISGGWGTGTGTPRAVNEARGETDETADDASDNTSDASETSDTQDPSEYQAPQYRVVDRAHSNITAGTEVVWYAHVLRDGEKQHRGVYRWNFGDGTEKILHHNTKKNFEARHTYQYAGEYYVLFEYYASQFSEHPEIQKSYKIMVSDVDILVKDTAGVVSITNNTTSVLDISHWKITQGDRVFIVPRGTLLLGSQSITLTRARTGFSGASTHKAQLYRADGTPVIPASVNISSPSPSAQSGNETALEAEKLPKTFVAGSVDMSKSDDNSFPLEMVIVGAGIVLAGAVIIYRRFLYKKPASDQPAEDTFSYIKILEE